MSDDFRGAVGQAAKRAFCVAAPNVWNSILNDIRNPSSLSSFLAKLKTLLGLLLHTRDEHNITNLRASVLTFR